MEQEKFKIEIDRKLISDTINEKIVGTILSQMELQKKDIESSIKDYFQKSFFRDKDTMFENALDWTIENAFRSGITKAMEDLNFTEVIASKAKEILSDNNFISELAEQKVRASLGLPQKH